MTKKRKPTRKLQPHQLAAVTGGQGNVAGGIGTSPSPSRPTGDIVAPPE
jgi:hypothetical protein